MGPTVPIWGRISRLVAFFLLFTPTLCDHLPYYDYDEYRTHGPAPIQHFKSSHVTAPIFNIDIWDKKNIDFDSPYIFFSLGDGSSSGPYIFSSKDLSLVYADRTWKASYNTRVQQWKNETYLTFWEGTAGKGHAQGICHMLNSKYEEVRRFKSKKLSAKTDLHECRLTDWGTVLFTVYENTPHDLTEVDGPVDGIIKDSVFEELDVETGELLFQWRASEHIPYSESYAEYKTEGTEHTWDPYHINTLQRDEEGNYFVSLRRLHALVKINGTDGSRIWQLGGKRNDFTDLSDGYATDFAWQHHVQIYNNETLVTMFDNHNLHGEREVGCIGQTCSRGSRIELDHEHMTARLLQNFYSPLGVMAYAMGSYDTLPNGNVLIGWGGMAQFTEYSSDGMPVMNVQFGKLGTWRRTYRVYKGDWHGYPAWPPSIALEIDDDSTSATIYVSWNGATEVVAWVFVTADDTETLTDLKPDAEHRVIAKNGFETELAWRDDLQFARVVAIDVNGDVLGATHIVDRADPESLVYVEESAENGEFTKTRGSMILGEADHVE